MTGAGAVRQQLVARSDALASPALGASQREHASVRAGIFIRQSMRPALAGAAWAIKSAPRARMEMKRRAFMAPQSTRERAWRDSGSLVASAGSRSRFTEKRVKSIYFKSFDIRRSLSGTPPVWQPGQ